MGNQATIKQIIEASIAVKQALLADERLLATTGRLTEALIAAYRNGGKVLFCGNGGSAADAQHLAAELSGKFYLQRTPLYAEALHVNTSYLTATANDFGYEHVFARLVEAKGRAGDVLIGLSTSGGSANVLRALEAARQRGMVTSGWTGARPGPLAARSDHLIAVPSIDTPRIQEAHLLIGHVICQQVEQALFG